MSSGPPARVRCVQRRVDALVIAYGIELAAEHKEALARAAAAAIEAGGAALVQIGRLCGALKRSPGEGMRPRYVVTCGEFDAVIDLTGAAQGWPLKIEWLALARAELRSIVRRSRAIAASVATPSAEGDGRDGVVDLQERVRRVDLAADFAGWRIDSTDPERMVGRSLRARGRGCFSDYRPAADDELGEGESLDRTVYRAGPKVTGYVVHAGAPLLLRIYDTIAELEHRGDAIKTESEHAAWSKAPDPWRPPAAGELAEPVTRVEVQVRSEVLREFSIAGTDGTREENTARNPERLCDLLDAIWSYATSAWIRMVRPETASRLSRCELDPRWAVARAVRFAHDACTLIRRRHRRGADVSGALGSMLSAVAAAGRSWPIALPDHALASERAAERTCRLLLDACALELAELAAHELLTVPAGKDRHEHLIGVAKLLQEKRNAAFGRFYVADDDESGGGHTMPASIVPAFLQADQFDADDRR